MTQTLVAKRRAARRINPALIPNRQITLFTSSNNNSFRSGVVPVLTGKYEIKIAGENRVHFADTLMAVAHLLSERLPGKAQPLDALVYLLEQGAQRGALAAGGVGVRFRSVAGENVFYSKVTGPVVRPEPVFAVDQFVFTDGLEGDTSRIKSGRISNIHVTNHPSAGRQYVYTVGAYPFSERQLRAATEVS